jgi:ATP-dependent Clp protease ATP-binding subunit ClpC
VPEDLRALETELRQVRHDKEQAVAAQDLDRAATLRQRENELETRRKAREEEPAPDATDRVMGEEEIAEVLAMWTGIPVYKLTEEETAKLLRMEEDLHKRIISQEEAIKALSRSIRRTRAGLKDPKRPSGSFIFAGPSGVGKTELAKALAEFLFGDEAALIQLDMSEYMEKHTVSRLIGSPPGYVGYEEGGQLTERVRRRPFSVVLFDEIEKAHPDVFNTLLQILEDGRLTDAQGRTVDFKNTVIIMTSNLGTRDLEKKGVGFAQKHVDSMDYDRMREKVHDEIKRQFRPEFLNRLDETIVFFPLTREDIRKIVDMMAKRITTQLKSKDVELVMTTEAMDLVGEKGYDQTLGARPLRRALQKMIEDPLSEKLLLNEYGAGSTVIIDAKDGEITFEVAPPTPDHPPLELTATGTE